MKSRYLFADVKGDISLGPGDLVRPFLLAPQQEHPFLTIGDYFAAVEKFVLTDNGKYLSLVPGSLSGRKIEHDHPIDEIVIRSEKHGALYHIASLEVFSGPLRERFAVTSAVGEQRRSCLENEYKLLVYLSETYGNSFLPRQHFKADVGAGGEEIRETIGMVLGEWLTAYCEWHLRLDRDGRQQVCIWDDRHGEQLLSLAAGGEIFRQAAKIITFFYNTRSYSQIYPWHHGAGDFVVRIEQGLVLDVKLISTRQYAAMLAFAVDDSAARITALVSFFLNLTLRMRLDKLNGTGEAVLAEGLVIGPVIDGFFMGLALLDKDGRYEAGVGLADFLSLLKAFSVSELSDMYQPLLEIYSQEDAEDFILIRSALAGHCQDLQAQLNTFCLTH